MVEAKKAVEKEIESERKGYDECYTSNKLINTV